jgi:predicted PurR-regulated permease PerM
MKTLKDLGLSLLNATLMLVIIFVVLSLILVSRVSTLAESAGDAARAALNAPSARIEQMTETLSEIGSDPGLSQIDGNRIDALTSEVQALNAQLSGIRGNLSEIPVDQIAMRLREEIGQALTSGATSLRSE